MGVFNIAKSYTVTKYFITVINNQDGSRKIYTDDELKDVLRSSDIRDNKFWRLLYYKYLLLECDEDYEILGLHSPNKEDWDVLYNMKSYKSR